RLDFSNVRHGAEHGGSRSALPGDGSGEPWQSPGASGWTPNDGRTRRPEALKSGTSPSSVRRLQSRNEPVTQLQSLDGPKRFTGPRGRRNVFNTYIRYGEPRGEPLESRLTRTPEVHPYRPRRRLYRRRPTRGARLRLTRPDRTGAIRRGRRRLAARG